MDLSYTANIRINDAIIAQHVLDSGAEGIFTDNLKDFRKVTGLKIIALRE